MEKIKVTLKSGANQEIQHIFNYVVFKVESGIIKHFTPLQKLRDLIDNEYLAKIGVNKNNFKEYLEKIKGFNFYTGVENYYARFGSLDPKYPHEATLASNLPSFLWELETAIMLKYDEELV
jgi:hypothetical protein